MNFPLALDCAATAGRNLHLRDTLMAEARTFSTTGRRAFYVAAARAHHRIAMESARDAKRLAALGELT